MNADSLTQTRAQALTLTQHITIQDDRDLALLMNAIQNACKVIANAIRKAGIAGLYGAADGVENASGDQVKKLDLLSNDVFCHCLKASNVCAVLVSEEEEEPIVCGGPNAPFCVAFDPLDGSSNVDCNVAVGSIFSVYRRTSALGQPPCDGDILRPGTDMVAAGYCMYGASSEFVLTYGKDAEVHRYALDPAVGEFEHIGPLKFPADGGKRIYSCNEGNSKHWDGAICGYVDAVKEAGYTARYVGSMVGDVHRTLLYGGIFMYPADAKSSKGKLRLLYEGFPMAMITENAGGTASTGKFNGAVGRILDVVPEGPHDRCPIIMGCKRDVDKVLAGYN